MAAAPLTPAEVALGYHFRTRHHPRRYAASLGCSIGETQPAPFRRHDGAPRFSLPLGGDRAAPSFGALFRPPPAGAASEPLDARSLGAWLELTLGITAWKRAGAARWALRANPSSGAL